MRDARDFNNIETRSCQVFFFLQGRAPKEIHAILTETLACFLPGRAKDLSALLYSWTPPTRMDILCGRNAELVNVGTGGRCICQGQWKFLET